MKKRDKFYNNYLTKTDKRGQGGFLGMGFGMIFSIILIIFFIVVAVIAIKYFLDFKNCSQVGIFMNDFQDRVTSVFDKQYGNVTFQGSLPTSVDYVCFIDFKKGFNGPSADIGEELSIYQGLSNNLFIYPRGSSCDMKYKYIKNLDLDAITKNENPYCIPNVRGNIFIRLTKNFNKPLVTAW